MRIAIAGGSGFLGSALALSLRSRGHHVTILTRHASGDDVVQWNPADPDGPWTAAVRQADAVVNLAGEPVEGGRWTAVRKRAILGSRVVATRAIVAVIASASRPPAALINASAVGLYGDRGDEIVTEAAPAGTGFLADVCTQWEAAAMTGAASTRVVLLRTGLVLDRRGGALPRLALPFWFLAGGPIGSGRQWWPWIHIDDWVRLATWTLETATIAGPVNLSAPAPARNAEFARRLGHALRRPSFVRTPAFALRVMLGEMADALVLGGQRAIPQRAEEGGFVFSYPELDAALNAIYGGS